VKDGESFERRRDETERYQTDQEILGRIQKRKRQKRHQRRVFSHFSLAPRLGWVLITAIGSTEGTDRNFLFWDVFKEFPISVSSSLVHMKIV
jgi:hypothetical protein